MLRDGALRTRRAAREALLQRAEEVDRLLFLHRPRRRHDLFSLGLALQELEDARSVVVLVLVRAEACGERRDELLGQLQLAPRRLRGRAREPLEILDVIDLVRV